MNNKEEIMENENGSEWALAIKVIIKEEMSVFGYELSRSDVEDLFQNVLMKDNSSTILESRLINDMIEWQDDKEEYKNK